MNEKDEIKKKIDQSRKEKMKALRDKKTIRK